MERFAGFVVSFTVRAKRGADNEPAVRAYLHCGDIARYTFYNT